MRSDRFLPSWGRTHRKNQTQKSWKGPREAIGRISRSLIIFCLDAEISMLRLKDLRLDIHFWWQKHPRSCCHRSPTMDHFDWKLDFRGQTWSIFCQVCSRIFRSYSWGTCAWETHSILSGLEIIGISSQVFKIFKLWIDMLKPRSLRSFLTSKMRVRISCLIINTLILIPGAP